MDPKPDNHKQVVRLIAPGIDLVARLTPDAIRKIVDAAVAAVLAEKTAEFDPCINKSAHAQPKADLPDDLRAYLDSVPPTTPEMVERVAAANRALEHDPAFLAELRRAREDI